MTDPDVTAASDELLLRARAALDEMMRLTASYRDDLVRSALDEREHILVAARADAAVIVRQAREEGERERASARSALDDVRAQLPELEELRARLGATADLLQQRRHGSISTPRDEPSPVPAGRLAVEVSKPTASETPPDDSPPPTAVEVFLRALAAQLETLDQARHKGDRDELGRVLHRLAVIARPVHADDVANLAASLDGDARPEELDLLIQACYRARTELAPTVFERSAPH